MNKNIWQNFWENAGRGCNVAAKTKRIPRLVVILSLPICPFFWMYYAMFRNEEEYAQTIRDYEEFLAEG
jgi:hypothetical protein